MSRAATRPGRQRREPSRFRWAMQGRPGRRAAAHRLRWMGTVGYMQERTALRERLKPFEKTLRVAGLGTISEVFDGDAPHSPQGCIAGAAGVGEGLRPWRLTHAPADGQA